jgi:Domain of unknown function (DUF4956)
MLSLDFLFRYLILLGGSLILLRAIYFQISPNRESFFSFFLFANGVFLVTYLLHNVELSMGFAFGLFAVFAMLRYRTEPISIRDMTYLFVAIGLSLMCSIAKVHYFELCAIILLVCALAALAETRFIAPRIVEKKINYDKVELIRPDKRDELIADLQQRTGFDIIKIEVGKIDYLSDSAQLNVFCREGSNTTRTTKNS